jgi:hypothetical protein
MARKTTRSQKEIDSAIKRYLAGESVNGLSKEYRISRAGMYLWLKKAKAEATQVKHVREVGKRGVEQEVRINKDLRLKQLEEENKKLKDRLFQLMNKYGEWG